MASPRACILSVSGPVLTADEKAFLSDAQPFGVILMGRSCLGRDQVQALVDSIWGALGRPCLIFIDQEGGRVARLKSPEWPVFPSARAYGDLYARDEDAGVRAAWLGHRLLAHELAAISIHADCAPVADLPVAGAHDVIGDRAFSQDPRAVVDLAQAALDGFRAGGVAGVVKHMPGHGRAMVDSHKDLPRVDASLSDLAADFSVFEALSAASLGMTAHIAYSAIDPDNPATLSPTVISKIIRGRIGFDGLLMTDDLSMNALGGDLASRAGAALAAGCDVALHGAGVVEDPSALLAEMEAVAGACPELAGDGLERAKLAEAAASRAELFDEAAGWAELRTLLGGAAAV